MLKSVPIRSDESVPPSVRDNQVGLVEEHLALRGDVKVLHLEQTTINH